MWNNCYRHVQENVFYHLLIVDYNLCAMDNPLFWKVPLGYLLLPLTEIKVLPKKWFKKNSNLQISLHPTLALPWWARCRERVWTLLLYINPPWTLNLGIVGRVVNSSLCPSPLMHAHCRFTFLRSVDQFRCLPLSRAYWLQREERACSANNNWPSKYLSKC